MALDGFLKFEGALKIEGESRQTGHEKEIEIQASSWSAFNHGSMHTGTGGGTEKGDFSDINLSMRMDKAVPLLMTACASGEHFDKATITIRKAGGSDKVDYLVVDLEPVLISQVSFSDASGSDGAMVSLSLNFAKITTKYKPQDEKGAAQAAITNSYDIPTGERA